ncbi:hypothetical protein FRC12_017370 [Ceratobasidium sp. 428]|nr:hypothetical protein FRC12_017370 [Ceratobasidium sp. 428]
MGSLWSHIHIDEYFVSNQYSSDTGRWISLWLKRSHDAPLSLRFVGRRFEQSNPEPIVALLRPHISGVSSLIFEKPSDQLVHAVFTLYGACTPSTSLITLVINMHHISATPWLTWPIDNIRGLRMLILCGLPDLRAPNFDDLAQILLNNPDIHTLRVRGYVPAPSHINSHPRAIMRKLKLLEYEYDSRFLVPEKLLSILEPGTNELDFVCKLPDNPDPMCFQEIQEFLERANVTRLELKNIRPECMGQEVSRHLDRTPHLRALSLDFATINDDSTSFDALTVTSDDGETRARCPNLRTLVICSMAMSPEAQAKLKQIVKVHRLNKLVFGSRTTTLDTPYSDVAELIRWLHQRIPTFVQAATFDPFNPFNPLAPRPTAEPPRRRVYM